jgi:hypothetical protein
MSVPEISVLKQSRAIQDEEETKDEMGNKSPVQQIGPAQPSMTSFSVSNVNKRPNSTLRHYADKKTVVAEKWLTI